MTKRFQSTSELAGEWGVKVGTIQRYVREGIIPHVRIGRSVLFDTKQIEQWINQGGQSLPGGWRKEQR